MLADPKRPQFQRTIRKGRTVETGAWVYANCVQSWLARMMDKVTKLRCSSVEARRVLPLLNFMYPEISDNAESPGDVGGGRGEVYGIEQLLRRHQIWRIQPLVK